LFCCIRPRRDIYIIAEGFECRPVPTPRQKIVGNPLVENSGFGNPRHSYFPPLSQLARRQERRFPPADTAAANQRAISGVARASAANSKEAVPPAPAS